MSPKIIFIAVLMNFIVFDNAFAGKEYYNWYFGLYSGITFNTPDLSPKLIKKGNMDAHEGCSTISDEYGNLLLYSNGETIYDSTHRIIADNIGGHNSSTQSCMIVKQPNTNSTYYTFTTESNEIFTGGTWPKLCYTVVDASNGNVSDKAHVLADSATEKVASVMHRNDLDVWIVNRKYDTNTFRLYKLTGGGISHVRDQSIGRSIPASENGFLQGYMKFSRDTRKLAVANRAFGSVEIFDFNNETGNISNPIEIGPPYIDGEVYGVEFSPNCRLLYVSTIASENAPTTGRIYQFDLYAGTEEEIGESGLLIAERGYQLAALQIAPNDKIYIAVFQNTYLSCINDPDTYGYQCNFQSNVVNIVNFHIAKSYWGLTNQVPGTLNRKLKVKANNGCPGDTIFLNAELLYAFGPEYRWAGPNGFTSDEAAPFIPDVDTTMTGWYYARSNYNGKTYIDSVYVFVNNFVAGIATDKPPVICENELLLLTAYPDGKEYSYEWEDGDNRRSRQVDEAGTYIVTVTDTNGCESVAEIEVIVNNYLEVEIRGPARICGNTPAELEAYPNDYRYHYLWSTGETTPEITIDKPGTYHVWVENIAGCEGRDTIVIEQYPESFVNITGDSLICSNESTLLSTDKEFEAYLWSTGETTRDILVSQADDYSLITTDDNGCNAYDTMTVSVYPMSDVEINGEDYLCSGRSAVLSSKNDFTEYLWSTGETTKEIQINEGGDYFLSVINDYGCRDTAYFSVEEVESPKAAINGETNLCEGETTTLSSENEAGAYLWSNGGTSREITVSEAGEYELIVSNSYGCRDTAIVNVAYYPNPEPLILGPDIFCKDDTVYLSADKEYASYEWSNGAVTNSINITEGGEYRLKVTNENGCVGYDTILTERIDIALSLSETAIDFGRLLVGSADSKSITIINNSGVEIELSASLNDNFFENNFNPGQLADDESDDILLSFEPDNILDYYDTLLIEVNEPCPGAYKIPVYGAGIVKMIARIPDVRAEINEDICIPVYARLATDYNIESLSGFDALVELDARVLLSENYGEIDGNKRRIRFENNNISLGKEEIQIAEICGTVMIGERDVSPVDFVSFNWLDGHVEVDTLNGSITLKGVCMRDFSRNESFESTEMTINPNPVSQNFAIAVSSEEYGSFELNIYNLQGEEIDNRSWQSSDIFEENILIDTENYSNGAYIVILKSPVNIIVKNIYIMK